MATEATTLHAQAFALDASRPPALVELSELWQNGPTDRLTADGAAGNALEKALRAVADAGVAPHSSGVPHDFSAARIPPVHGDNGTLLELAQDLAIQVVLERFQRGEVRANAVRPVLEKMGGDLEFLQELLATRDERLASAAIPGETQADVLNRKFWDAAPAPAKETVLASPEAWCVPARGVQQCVRELLKHEDMDGAEKILVNYAACLRSSVREARKNTAMGLEQLAELFGMAAAGRLDKTLAEIGRQMASEKDAGLQSALSAAFVRLSQEAAQRCCYRAMQESLDALEDLEEMRPTRAQNLRPYIGVVNRIPEFVEGALRAKSVPEGLTGVLMRSPKGTAEYLAGRLARAARRSEREKVVGLAKEVGNPCTRHLTAVLKSGQPAKAASVVGLLSRLDANAVNDLLPERLHHGGRSFHDTVVVQLSIAGAPQRGRLLANYLELLDAMALPLALDEIGLCRFKGAVPKLLRYAEGKTPAAAPDYLRVKAIEALGRIGTTDAEENLRRFLTSRGRLGWTYPEEMRTAAAQALKKFDANWLRNYLPCSGLSERALALAPLDPVPERDVVRHRRYKRIHLLRSVPAVVTSAEGRRSSAIGVLSLEGGLLTEDIELPVGTEATLKIPAGLRSITLQTVVRFVCANQTGFETIGARLKDRAKLRRLLISLGGDTISPA